MRDSYVALMDVYWWSVKYKNNCNCELALKRVKPELSVKLAQTYKRMNESKAEKKIMDSIIKNTKNTEYLK
jgi:hypothetical protein